MEQTWKPTVDLRHLGPRPNIFDLIGGVGLALKQLDRRDSREEMYSRAKDAHSYEAAIAVLRDYVDLKLDGEDSE